MANPNYVTSVTNGAARVQTVRRDSLEMFECFRNKSGGRVYAHVGKTTIPPSRAVQFKSVVVQGEIGTSPRSRTASDGLCNESSASKQVIPCGWASLAVALTD